MQTTRLVYVFDLDGVITDPRDSKVDEKIVDTMRQLMTDGHFLTINTGRSFEWVEKNLLDRLVAGLPDEALQDLIIICEKGGETVQWQDNQWIVRPSQFALLPEVHRQAEEVFKRLADQLPTMFWDATKRTMATVEKRPESDLAAFHTERRLLVDELHGALGDKEVRIDATTIATDIESPSAGKHAGAELIYEWVKGISTITHRFFCIGDSTSDYEMARFFADKGLEATFVYVGEPTDNILHHKDVIFIATNAHYVAGTREYFAVLDDE